MTSLLFFAAIVLVGLVGCETLNAPNTEGTLQAQRDGYVVEATAIEQTARANSTEVSGTAVAAATYIVEQNLINAMLVATVQAVVPPTQQIVAVSGGVNTPSAIAEGRRWFVKTGTSTSIRESDGCIETPQIQFTSTTPRIYAGVQAFNISAGTPITVEWYYEGTSRWQETITLEQDAGQICLWFYIEPTFVEFTPGTWAVSMFTEGFQLESPMSFTITQA